MGGGRCVWEGLDLSPLLQYSHDVRPGSASALRGMRPGLSFFHRAPAVPVRASTRVSTWVW